MRMWCPHCGAEYVEGWGTCSTCGVLLVEDQPSTVTLEDEAWGLPRRRDLEDPFITIWEGPTPDASELLQKIQSRHIPADLDDALEVGHARVTVPRSYLPEVRDIVLGLVPALPEVSVETVRGLEWKPAIKIAIAVTAIVLLVLLLFIQ
jgi:hypothetical protein